MSLTPAEQDFLDRLAAVEKKMADLFSGRAGVRPDPRWQCQCGEGD